MSHEPVSSILGLRTHVASGVRWGIIVSITTQVSRLLFLITLMRLLGPWSFGVVGQAVVVIAIGQIFVNLGLAASIVQRPQLEQEEIAAAFWLNAATGLLLCILVFLNAPFFSAFFRTEELTIVLQVLSISLLLKSITIVPTALLTRNMQFGKIGLAEIASTAISGALGVGAAVSGASYWSLVIQAVSLELIYLVLIWRLNPLSNLAWSSSAARRLWSFSSRMMGADLVYCASANIDKLLIGRFLGPTSLGVYSLAYRVPQLTLAIAGQVCKAIFPSFSRLQEDRERLAKAFLHSNAAITLVIFPAMTLVILAAPIAVPEVFGEAWIDAIVPIQLLAAMIVPKLLVSNMGPLTIAVGKANWEFHWSLVTLTMSLVLFPIGLFWGLPGLATVYLVMFGAQCPIRFAITQRLIPITVRSYIRALAPAFTCSLALAVAYSLSETFMARTMSGLFLVAGSSFSGAVVYVLVLRVAWPSDFQRQLDFVKLVVRGSRG